MPEIVFGDGAAGQTGKNGNVPGLARFNRQEGDRYGAKPVAGRSFSVLVLIVVNVMCCRPFSLDVTGVGF